PAMLARLALVLIVVACSTANAKPPSGAFVYPPARRDGTVDDLHGHKVADPYRWMEQMDAPETRTWLAAENQQTDAYLAAIPGRAALHDRLAELQSYERFTPPERQGNRYF